MGPASSFSDLLPVPSKRARGRTEMREGRARTGHSDKSGRGRRGAQKRQVTGG